MSTAGTLATRIDREHDLSRQTAIERDRAKAKVLYVIDEFVTASAGTEGQLLALIGGLDPLRYEPHLAVFRQSEFLESCSKFPCPVHVLNVARVASPSGLVRLAGLSRLVTHLGTGLTHIFFNDAAIAAPFFCRLAGARAIAARRDMGFWYTPGKLRALRVSNRFVDRIVANSEAVKRNVHSREGYPLDRISVVANGHSQQRFETAAAAGFRQQLGIGAGDKVIGMVANLNPRKRQVDLIRALPEIQRALGRVHVVLVGKGPDRDELLRVAGAAGLSGNVHIVPADDAVPLIKHFDVAVLCSESEGFSNALIEYAFCARPIVCTNVGGNPEFVQHRESGLLIDCGDVAGLVASVTDLLSKPELAVRLSTAARSLALRHCTREAMLTSYMDLYDDVRSLTASMQPA